MLKIIDTDVLKEKAEQLREDICTLSHDPSSFVADEVYLKNLDSEREKRFFETMPDNTRIGMKYAMAARLVKESTALLSAASILEAEGVPCKVEKIDNGDIVLLEDDCSFEFLDELQKLLVRMGKKDICLINLGKSKEWKLLKPDQEKVLLIRSEISMQLAEKMSEMLKPYFKDVVFTAGAKVEVVSDKP